MQFTMCCFIAFESKLVFAQYFIAKSIAMQSFWLYQLDEMCQNSLLQELWVFSFPWKVRDLFLTNQLHYLPSLTKQANALTMAYAKVAFFAHQIMGEYQIKGDSSQAVSPDF